MAPCLKSHPDAEISFRRHRAFGHIWFTPYGLLGSERWPLSFCSSPRCCGTETSNEERHPPPGPSTPSPPEIPPTSRCLYCTGGEACPDPFLGPTLLSTTKSSMSTTGELSVPGGEVRDATAPKPPFNPQVRASDLFDLTLNELSGFAAQAPDPVPQHVRRQTDGIHGWRLRSCLACSRSRQLHPD